MARVICPFCLRTHDMSDFRCPEHPEYEIPNNYIHDYQRVPPLWLTTIGFSQHGKTTYLAMLTIMLEKLSNVLRGMWYVTLDSFTFNAVIDMRAEMDNCAQPDKTRKDEHTRPLLFHVNDMPDIPSRCLVLYDVAGEIFDTFEGVEQYAKSIRQVNTAWFLVSLPDLEKSPRRISDLFTVYMNGLQRLRVDFRGWNLIVVYTKADKYLFNREIKEYISGDPLRALIGTGQADGEDEFSLSMESYIDRMEEMSEVLRRYTCAHVDGGNAFVSMVRAYGMNLYFSVSSALGQDTDQQGLLGVARPHRVIDPLLWALKLQERKAPASFRLVVDASQDAESIYEDGIVEGIWDALSDHGEVATYFLGQRKPTAVSGQSPPKAAPGFSRPRLVGPILDDAAAEDKIVVLTTGPVTDLREFSGDSLKARILVIKVDEDFSMNWPNVRIFRSGDDPTTIIEDLNNLS